MLFWFVHLLFQWPEMNCFIVYMVEKLTGKKKNICKVKNKKTEIETGSNWSPLTVHDWGESGLLIFYLYCTNMLSDIAGLILSGSKKQDLRRKRPLTPCDNSMRCRSQNKTFNVILGKHWQTGFFLSFIYIQWILLSVFQ